MRKNYLLVIALCIGFLALMNIDVKASWNLANLTDQSSKLSYWASYEGCIEVTGGGPTDFTSWGLFVPRYAVVSALNNGGNEALSGVGHVTGASTEPQDAFFQYDYDTGKFFVCFDLPSNADECVELVDGEPRFPGCYSKLSCGDRYCAFAEYWGINTDDLKNNEVPYRLFMTEIDAWYAVDEDPDFTGPPLVYCHTTADPRYFPQLAPIEFTCIPYGLAFGVDDKFSFKKAKVPIYSVDASQGLLINDFDSDGESADLTVTQVQADEVPGVLTVYPDGSFVWDLTDVDFPGGTVEWTYTPFDGSAGPNKTYAPTVTMNIK